MKKNIIYFGALIVVLLLLSSSMGITANEAKTPEEDQYNLNLEGINNKLSKLELSLDNTYEEYKQAIYKFVSINNQGTPEMLAAQLNDLEQLFAEIEEMGINLDMTLKEIIESTGLFFTFILVECDYYIPGVGWRPLVNKWVVCKNLNTGFERRKKTGVLGYCIFLGMRKHHDYKIYLKDYPDVQKTVYDLILFAWVTLTVSD